MWFHLPPLYPVPQIDLLAARKVVSTVRVVIQEIAYHFRGRMEGLDTLQYCSTIVSNDCFSFGSLDLWTLEFFCGASHFHYCTILSIPLGPKDVRTASLIAGSIVQSKFYSKVFEEPFAATMFDNRNSIGLP